MHCKNQAYWNVSLKYMDTTYEVEGEIIREVTEQPPIVVEYDRSGIEAALVSSTERRDLKVLELQGAQQEVDRLQEIMNKFSVSVEDAK